MSRYLATIVKKKKKKLKSNAKNYFLSRFYLSFYLKRTKKKMWLTLLIKFTRGKFKYSLHIFNNYNNMVAIIIFFFFLHSIWTGYPWYLIRCKMSRILHFLFYDCDCGYGQSGDLSKGLREIETLSVEQIGISLESK